MSSSRIAPSPPASSTVYMSSAEDKKHTQEQKYIENRRDALTKTCARGKKEKKKNEKKKPPKQARLLVFPWQTPGPTEATRSQRRRSLAPSREARRHQSSQARRHKAHNDFRRNESTQRGKTAGKMKMTSNWICLLRSGGAATRICTLSSGAGWSHVAAPDKEGGTFFPNKGFEFCARLPVHLPLLHSSLSVSAEILHSRPPTFSLTSSALISSSSCQRSDSAEG